MAVFNNCDKQFNFGTEHSNGFNLSQIKKMFNLTFCSTYDIDVQTGWKNNRREYVWGEKMTGGNVLGGKMTGGNMS